MLKPTHRESIPAHPAAMPAGAEDVVLLQEDALGLAFEASCRPSSWSLFGVHVRTAHDGTRLGAGGPGRSGDLGCAWGDADIVQAVRSARALASQLGQARLWLHCPEGLLEPRRLTHLAGSAALAGVALQSLGLEVSSEALWQMGEPDRLRVLELRAAGLDVALSLDVAELESLQGLGSQRVPVIDRAHGLRMTVFVGGVRDRSIAGRLGGAGVSAISGPVVSSSRSLESMRRFLGPREPSLDRMRADSL